MLVVNLDEYDIIFGLDFLKKAKIILMSYLNGVMIASKGCPCFVPYCNIATTNFIKGEKAWSRPLLLIKHYEKVGKCLL